MVSIEVDAQTAGTLEFAARMSHVTAGEVVARLVRQASLVSPDDAAAAEPGDGRVAVYADYEGFRTQGRYDAATSRIDITSGPLDGKSYKSPSSAARGVVAHYKPGVSPHRNGWSFWMLDDGSGRALQTIRTTRP